MLQVHSDRIRVPDKLIGRIRFVDKCHLQPLEIAAINASLYALDRAIANDNSIAPDADVNLIFSSTDSLNLFQGNPGVMGHCYQLVVYYVHRWRLQNLPLNTMVVVILEELCHHFWNIRDEVRVKYKVLELYHHIDPSIEMQDLYLSGW